MYLFDRRSLFLLLCCTLPLLFLPKINLIQFAGETSGIRIDDIVLFLFASVTLWAILQTQKPLSPLERYPIYITLFSFFSFFINRLLVYSDFLHIDSKIFYCVRVLEYFFFFYVGSFASRFFRLENFFAIFFAFLMVIMICQKLGIIGGITSEGYVSSITGNVIGIAAFPGEMGCILNFLFAFFAFSENFKNQIISFFPNSLHQFIKNSYTYFLFAIFFIFTALTENRIAILTLLFCFLGRLKYEFSFQSLPSKMFVLLVAISLLCGAALTIPNLNELKARSENLISMQNFEAFSQAWDSIDITYNPLGQESKEGFKQYDASWWMRIHKWMFAIKIFINHPECYFQGLGPGANFAALDGGWLRIFVENGFIGTLLFLRFFYLMFRQNLQMKWIMIAFAINMITFDVYLAYKVMSILFLTSGYFYAVSFSLELSQNKVCMLSRAEFDNIKIAQQT